jgi:uncharacterized protein YlzI (FlbEa/FlbD family)
MISPHNKLLAGDSQNQGLAPSLFYRSSLERKNSYKNYFNFLNVLSEDQFVSLSDISVKKTTVHTIFYALQINDFIESESTNPDSTFAKLAIGKHYSIKSSLSEICNSNVKYLQSIDSLCKSNQIELYFCTTLYHKNYKEMANTKHKDLSYNTLNGFIVRHIDFLSCTPPNSWMSDGNHLNKKGAAN